MLDKKSLLIRVIAGGALLYVGGDIFLSAMREKPDNYLLYCTVSAVFIILGGIWAFLAVKKLAAHDYKEMLDDDVNDMNEILEENKEEEGK